ncbi:hypothetical protein CHRYSEO8AT_440081 [Chryseobacterium sp. 8AT]|nr:hypothetical protein CHRYSEO8AT_440081 [Chryseobacterium sp. 8AT]
MLSFPHEIINIETKIKMTFLIILQKYKLDLDFGRQISAFQ